jgi:hypothetical protein
MPSIVAKHRGPTSPGRKTPAAAAGFALANLLRHPHIY